MTDNIQATHVPDTLVEDQLFEASAVLDGLLVRGRIALPHIVQSGVLRFAARTGGDVVESNRPGERLAEMIRRIKSRYSIHFHPADSVSAHPRKIRIELTAPARRRYPAAIVRSRTRYFPKSRYKPKEDVPVNRKVARSPRAVHFERSWSDRFSRFCWWLPAGRSLGNRQFPPPA